MSKARDYKLCDICAGQTFYYTMVGLTSDPEDVPPARAGDWKVICVECAKEHSCIIEKKERCQRGIVSRLLDVVFANDEDAETLVDAANAIQILATVVRYADTRAVSRAGYPHACLEERHLRDLIDRAARWIECGEKTLPTIVTYPPYGAGPSPEPGK